MTPSLTRKALRCARSTPASPPRRASTRTSTASMRNGSLRSLYQSQAHEGWELIPDHFDDGGSPAATWTARPAAADGPRHARRSRHHRRLQDRPAHPLPHGLCQARRTFDKHDVSFVSVTQSLNTKDSMGRLMLNVLLSFAQFERELTGERIRDKFAASKRRGMWMGGPSRSATTSRIACSSSTRPKPRPSARSSTSTSSWAMFGWSRRNCAGSGCDQELRLGARAGMGDQAFTRGYLYKLLGNPLYVGDISHKGERHKGQHDAIVDKVIWDKVQAMLGGNTQGKRQRANATGAQSARRSAGRRVRQHADGDACGQGRQDVPVLHEQAIGGARRAQPAGQWLPDSARARSSRLSCARS